MKRGEAIEVSLELMVEKVDGRQTLRGWERKAPSKTRAETSEEGERRKQRQEGGDGRLAGA